MNRKIKNIIANTVIIALILIGMGWIASIFIHPSVEFTNNAQINRDIVPVSSRAQLNLSYTVVLAPCNGFVSRKTIQ